MLAHPPLVSVLVPARNEEDSIVEAIESIRAQSWNLLEILVLDGLSEDATRDLVQAIRDVDPRVKLLANPKRDIPSALNIGLRAALGEYVVRVDAHWTVNPTYIETGLKVIAAEPGVAVVGGRRNGRGSSKMGKAVAVALSSRFGVGNSLYHYGDRSQDTDHASGGVYRADVLREAGGWDESLLVNEDVDIDHRILAHGHRIRFEPTMVATWRVRESLTDLARQYRRYGRGKAAMVRKNGTSAVRIRHLAAPSLIVTLPLGLVAGLAGRRSVSTGLIAPYLIALTAASLAGSKQDTEMTPVMDAPRLMAAFATMHLSWGIGFLEGALLAKPPAQSSGKL